MKRSLLFAAAVFFIAFAAWRLMPEKAIKQIPPAEMPAAPVPAPSSPVAASSAEPIHAGRKISVAKSRPKPALKIGKLLIEDDKPVKAMKNQNLFSSALTSRDKPNVNLDLGSKLPWPLPDSPWMPKNRDLGFHLGLDYQVNEHFNLTGIAGVSVPAEADSYTLKPNVEQIGVRARYRF